MKLPFSAEQLRPPARGDIVFSGGIKHPDIFIWDAWSLPRNDALYLYTLGTPREVFATGGVDIQTQRDHIPHHHRLFVSKDDGKTWRDEGPVFWPRNDDESAFDSRSIWTGSVVEYDGSIIGGYTGIRLTDDDHPFLQSVGLSVSNDGGKSYQRLSKEALSCPQRDYDAIRQMGYYLGPKDDLGTSAGEEGGSILAWRDPGLVVDAKTNQLHAFWSAKSDTHAKQEAVLAHAIIHDPLTNPRAELLPPTRLPDGAEFTQAEVPQLLYSKAHETYYLAVSTTDATQGQTDADLNLNTRLYASPALNGPWTYVGHLIEKKDRLYPAVLIALEDTAKGVNIKYLAPYNRSNGPDIMHTMPECRHAVIENGKVIAIHKDGEAALAAGTA